MCVDDDDSDGCCGGFGCFHDPNSDTCSSSSSDDDDANDDDAIFSCFCELTASFVVILYRVIVFFSCLHKRLSIGWMY